MGVLITTKGKKKESSAPVLDILEATIKTLSAEYRAAGDVVTKNRPTRKFRWLCVHFQWRRRRRFGKGTRSSAVAQPAD